jgi:hypothetical protein
MKKEEIKLSLVLLLGGLGILFCVYYFDIPYLPGSKYRYDEQYTYLSKGKHYPVIHSEHKLPVASYRSVGNNRSNSNNKLMTPQINTAVSKVNYQSNNDGYHFNETDTKMGSNAPLFTKNSPTKPSAAGGSGGNISGFYAYSSRGSSNDNASGQASGSRMLVTSELGEPFTNYSPTGPKKVVDYTPNSGATDPGGDPTEPPIPVGEGWGILFLLAAGYASFIKLRAKR